MFSHTNLQVRVLRGAIEDLRHELQQAEERAAFVEGVTRECVCLRTHTHTIYVYTHTHYICLHTHAVYVEGVSGKCICLHTHTLYVYVYTLIQCM